ncbi:hypothetical protein ACQ5SK_02635 [Bradyrhizobium japonicum]
MISSIAGQRRGRWEQQRITPDEKSDCDPDRRAGLVCVLPEQAADERRTELRDRDERQKTNHGQWIGLVDQAVHQIGEQQYAEDRQPAHRHQHRGHRLALRAQAEES